MAKMYVNPRTYSKCVQKFKLVMHLDDGEKIPIALCTDIYVELDDIGYLIFEGEYISRYDLSDQGDSKMV